MKGDFRISIDSIEPTHENLRALSVYLLIKFQYDNGVVYNYMGASPKLKRVSKHQLRKYAKVLIDLGLAEDSKGNLRTLSLSELKHFSSHKKKKEIFIKKSDNVHSVVNKLRIVLFRYYVIDRQKYISDYKTDLLNLGADRVEAKSLLRRVKKASKKGYDVGDVEKVNSDVWIGYRKGSKVVGLSLASFRGFLQFLKNEGVIEDFRSSIHPIRRGVKGSEFLRKYSENNKGYFYIHGSTLYKHCGTQLRAGTIS
jgi:hypothetical protein